MSRLALSRLALSHLALSLLALAACVPKAPPSPPAAARIEVPATYKPIALHELPRPLPASPERCAVGTRQAGPVITELVACGDRGVTRVMVLPSKAPSPDDMLQMAQNALADTETLSVELVGFPYNGRGLAAHRLLRGFGQDATFAGLAVVHPEAPWPELLTCSAPAPVDNLEGWCAAAIGALLMPDDPARLAAPARR